LSKYRYKVTSQLRAVLCCVSVCQRCGLHSEKLISWLWDGCESDAGPAWCLASCSASSEITVSHSILRPPPPRALLSPLRFAAATKLASRALLLPTLLRNPLPRDGLTCWVTGAEQNASIARDQIRRASTTQAWTIYVTLAGTRPPGPRPDKMGRNAVCASSPAWVASTPSVRSADIRLADSSHIYQHQLPRSAGDRSPGASFQVVVDTWAYTKTSAKLGTQRYRKKGWTEGWLPKHSTDAIQAIFKSTSREEVRHLELEQ
jgi:hypothetical protein